MSWNPSEAALIHLSSRTYHPDRVGPEYAEHFIAIRHAYEGLTDPVKRYAYDRWLFQTNDSFGDS